MAAFKTLRDNSKNFEEELQRGSNELFSDKIEESFEEHIAKKLRDLSLYTAKLRLLRANPASLTPQVSQHERDEDSTLAAYEETVANRIIEQQLVKAVTQSHAVKALVTAPDRTLEPMMVERKEKIIEALSAYRVQEATVQHMDSLLQEKEAKLVEMRDQWDRELRLLRDMRGGHAQGPDVDVNEPLYQKLSTTVTKLELMGWLAGRLGVPRNRGYDWLADPQSRLQALKLARQRYSVDQFLESS